MLLLWVPTEPGGLTLPVLGTGLCSCRKGHRAAQAANRPMYLACHSLTRAQVSSHRFGFLGGINSDVLSRPPCAFNFS
jgi:hypothetical protein